MTTKEFIKNVYYGKIDHFFILDTETTGIDVFNDGIIQASILEIMNGKVINEYDSLYNPGMKISPFIENLTGISNNDILGKPLISQDKEFNTFLNKDLPIVAHNYSFDKTILKSNGVDLSNFIWIDSVYIAKILFPGRETYKQDVLVDAYGDQSPYFNKRHNALNDVYNLAYVLKKGFQDIKDIDETISVLVQPGFSKTDDYNEEYKVNKQHIKKSLGGRVVCFTGSLRVKREAMIKLIEENGAIFSKGLTKKVDLLVVGEAPGSKLKKAEENGIEIINENEFEELIN